MPTPSIETQLAVLNTKLDTIIDRLGGIGKRLEGIEAEQDTIQARLTEHSIKFARAEGAAAAVPRPIVGGDASTAIVVDPAAPAGALRRPAVIAAGTGGLGTLLFLLVRYLFGF